MTETTYSEIYPICDVCEREVYKISSKPILIGCEDMLCTDCWNEWYDSGITNPKKLGQHVVKKFGKYGGCAAPQECGAGI